MLFLPVVVIVGSDEVDDGLDEVLVTNVVLLIVASTDEVDEVDEIEAEVAVEPVPPLARQYAKPVSSTHDDPEIGFWECQYKILTQVEEILSNLPGLEIELGLGR